jgi:hypothetical protein
MKMHLKHEGAGIFSELMDFLREQERYQAPMTSIPEIAYLLHADQDKLSSLITDFDLFKIENAIFFSPWLCASLKPLDEKRKRQSEGAKVRNAEYWKKQRERTDQQAVSNLSVTDQQAAASKEEKNKEEENKRKDSKALTEGFEIFWNVFDKKVDRKKAEKLWSTLTDLERARIMQHAPDYVKSTPDKNYRKDPATYLRNKSFDNEIIPCHGNSSTSSAVSKSLPIGKSISATAGSQKNAGNRELIDRLSTDLRINF